MQLLTLGVNHHTAPLAIREQVAFGPEKLVQALHELTQSRRASEVAILSTCNRTELYVNTPSADDVTQWLADFHHIERRELAPYLDALPREKAAQHAFRVAAGLDSMVLGETQILGPMKQAGQDLEFEKAALLRDQIFELRQELEDEKLPEWERVRKADRLPS